MPRKRKSNDPRNLKVTTIQEAYDGFVAVIEQQDGKFEVLAEGQRGLQEQIDRRFSEVKKKIDDLNARLTRIEGTIDRLETEMKDVRDELNMIRFELKHTASTKEAIALDRRITKLERQMARK